jgi:hypothetical protein
MSGVRLRQRFAAAESSGSGDAQIGISDEGPVSPRNRAARSSSRSRATFFVSLPLFEA